MKVASALCVVVSSITSVVARGVTPVLAAPYAATMVLKENVVTASMLDAMMPRILSTASAPIRAGSDAGMKSFNTTAIKAVATPSSENKVARNHSRLVTRTAIQRQRAIIRKPSRQPTP